MQKQREKTSAIIFEKQFYLKGYKGISKHFGGHHSAVRNIIYKVENTEGIFLSFPGVSGLTNSPQCQSA